MFNFGPSPEMLQRILPILGRGGGGGGIGVGGPSGPPVDMPMGPTPTFPPTGGGMPPSSQPPIMDSAPQGVMGRFRDMMMRPQDGVSASPMPFQGMAGKMSPNRPGLWGKFNAISQALQPMAMQSLMGQRGRNAQRQSY